MGQNENMKRNEQWMDDEDEYNGNNEEQKQNFSNGGEERHYPVSHRNSSSQN